MFVDVLKRYLLIVWNFFFGQVRQFLKFFCVYFYSYTTSCRKFNIIDVYGVCTHNYYPYANWIFDGRRTKGRRPRTRRLYTRFQLLFDRGYAIRAPTTLSPADYNCTRSWFSGVEFRRKLEDERPSRGRGPGV